MKEQSHKNEMSAAIRGDFRRLRDRGVSATLLPQEEPAPEREPVASEGASLAPAEPDADAGTDAYLREAPEPEVVVADEPEVRAAAPDVVEEAEPPRRGWLGRLAGR